MRSDEGQRVGALVLVALAVAALSFVAFLPALKAGFVNWDDDVNFLLNKSYRGLSLEHLKWMFTTFHLGPYQPLSWMTLGLDYTLWGMDPRGYHLTSLIIHSLNAGVVTMVAAALFGRALGLKTRPKSSPGAERGLVTFAAFATALLYAVHPLRVESVAWVTERRDVLSGLFFSLAVWAYVATPRRPRAAFAAWVLSLLSKATGVTLPFLLLILDVYPLRRLPGNPRHWLRPAHRQVLVEKIPYFVVALCFGVLALVAQGRAGALETIANFGLIERFGVMTFAIAFYVLKMVVPFALSPKYELPDNFNPVGPAVLIAGAFIILASLFAFRARKSHPAILAAWIAYLVLVLPISGVARAGNVLAADRYTYLAALPLTLLAGSCLLGGIRFGNPSGKPSRASTGSFGRVAALTVAAFLGLLTFKQTRIWNDSISLWSHARQFNPRSTSMSLSLAYAFVEADRLTEAEQIYRDLLERDRSLADARYNFGMLLYKQNRTAEAESEFARLTHEAPNFADGHYGLGIVHMLQGRTDQARMEMEQVLRLQPGHEGARKALQEMER